MGGFLAKMGEWNLVKFVKMGGLFRQNGGGLNLGKLYKIAKMSKIRIEQK